MLLGKGRNLGLPFWTREGQAMGGVCRVSPMQQFHQMFGAKSTQIIMISSLKHNWSGRVRRCVFLDRWFRWQSIELGERTLYCFFSNDFRELLY